MKTITLKLIDIIVPKEGKRKKLLSLDGLRESIQTVGLLHPPSVFPVGHDYHLAAGRRRLQALTELGWKETECRVLDPDQALAAQFDENEYRAPLPKSERAALAQRYYETYPHRLNRPWTKRSKVRLELGAIAPSSSNIRDEKNRAGEQAAQWAGLGSRRTYEKVLRVKSGGSSALVQAMDEELVSVDDACKVLKYPLDFQDACVERVREKKDTTVHKAASQLIKVRLGEERQAKKEAKFKAWAEARAANKAKKQAAAEEQKARSKAKRAAARKEKEEAKRQEEAAAAEARKLALELQSSPDNPMLDDFGHVVPSCAESAFTYKKEYYAAGLKLLHEAIDFFEKYCVMPCGLKSLPANVVTPLRGVVEEVKTKAPYAACPYCYDKPKRCAPGVGCSGLGWVTQFVYGQSKERRPSK